MEQKYSAITVKFNDWKMVSGVQVPLPDRKINLDKEDVVECTGEEMEPKTMKSINILTSGEKRFMVNQMWGNNVGDAGRTKPGRMLADEELTGIFEYLQWQYQMPEVVLVKAAMVKMVVYEGVKSEPGRMAIMEIVDMWQRCEVLVVE